MTNNQEINQYSEISQMPQISRFIVCSEITELFKGNRPQREKEKEVYAMKGHGSNASSFCLILSQRDTNHHIFY